MADKHKMHSNCRLLPEDIVCKITQRNNITRANTCDPALKLLNEEITSNIQKHKQNIWKEHLDTHWEHRHKTHLLWKTIHDISNNIHKHATLKTNRSIDRATQYTQHHTHHFSGPRGNKTAKNNSQGPDKLTISYLKHIGPLGLEFLTSMFKTALNNNIILHTLAPPVRTLTVALDMSKALDTNIHTLIRKLLHTNIPGTISKFIANFTKGRKAYTTYTNHTSRQRNSKLAFHKAASFHPHYLTFTPQTYHHRVHRFRSWSTQMTR